MTPERRQGTRPLRPVPAAGIQGDAREQAEELREPAAGRRGRTGPRVDQDGGVSREELRARRPDRQSRQGLPAAGRGLRRARLREHAALRSRLAGLRRLLSQPLLAPLQGADLLRLLVDDRGCCGVRRPEQHGRRPRQRLQPVQAEDDRRLDDLHGRGHRRRPERLHQDLQGKGLGAAGVRRAVRAHAGLRRQPHHRLRQRHEGHPRTFLERQGRHGAEAGTRRRTARSTSSAASTATRSAICARSSGFSS